MADKLVDFKLVLDLTETNAQITTNITKSFDDIRKGHNASQSHEEMGDQLGVTIACLRESIQRLEEAKKRLDDYPDMINANYASWLERMINQEKYTGYHQTQTREGGDRCLEDCSAEKRLDIALVASYINNYNGELLSDMRSVHLPNNSFASLVSRYIKSQQLTALDTLTMNDGETIRKLAGMLNLIKGEVRWAHSQRERKIEKEAKKQNESREIGIKKTKNEIKK